MIARDEEKPQAEEPTQPSPPEAPAPVELRKKVPLPEVPPPPPPQATPAQLAILEGLASSFKIPDPVKGRPLLEVGVFLQLAYGSPRRGVFKALDLIKSSTVDWNEVRISSMAEYLDWCSTCGAKGLMEKCEKVMLFLSNVYRDHNNVSLVTLEDMTRDERGKYLASVEPLTPWMVHFMLNSCEEYRDFIFSNDMNRVLQRLGLIKREGSPRKAAEAALKLFGGHPKTLAIQCALIAHGTETCVSAIRVNLCRSCSLGDKCPSNKAK